MRLALGVGFAALVTVLVLGASPAAAFIESRGECFNECLEWQLPPTARSVGYAVNPTTPVGSVGMLCPNADDVSAAVVKGFSQWSLARQSGATQPCTDLRLTPAATPSTSRSTSQDSANIVLFRTRLCTAVPAFRSDPSCNGPEDVGSDDCASRYDCWDDSGGIIAKTSVLYRVESGQIFEADMQFNATSGVPGRRFTCEANGPTAVETDIWNTAAHEAGHFIGLGHPCGEPGVQPFPDRAAPGCVSLDATMHATANSGETGKRDLDPDDVNGVCTLYPAGAPAPTCNGALQTSSCSTSSSSSSSGCGCGSAHPGLLALLAAPVLLLRRRRAVRSPRV